MADNSNNPNNVYNNQDGLHTDFEMLTISPRAFRNRRQKKCCNAITNDTICYSNTLFFTVLIMQFLIIYIVFAVYSADLNILIKDAKINLKDLSLILPEVSNVLEIVRQICKAPEYAPYCHVDINITEL